MFTRRMVERVLGDGGYGGFEDMGIHVEEMTLYRKELMEGSVHIGEHDSLVLGPN
jgi:hypothetical protein